MTMLAMRPTRQRTYTDLKVCDSENIASPMEMQCRSLLEDTKRELRGAFILYVRVINEVPL